MVKQRNRGFVRLKTEVKDLISNLRKAQSDLRKLRAMGADESAIRKVMLAMGFANVTPDEFLAANTAEDLERLIAKLGRPQSN